MKPEESDPSLKSQEQIIARCLTVLVDDHGVIQAVQGGWNPFATSAPETGGDCFDFLPLSASPMAQALRQVLAHGSSGIRIETHQPAALGDLWLEATITPLSLHGDHGAVLTFIDITTRKQVELALRGSEERFRIMIEHEPECVKIIELDGTLREMNPAGLKIIEAESLAQVAGLQVVSLVHPDDREMFLRLHHKVCAGESGQERFRVTGIKGTLSWVETHSVPLRGPEGTVTAALCVTQDITAKRAAEEQLRQSESNMAAAQRISRFGSWRLDLNDQSDPDKNTLRWSDEIYRILGYEVGEIEASNENFFRAVHPDDRERIRQAVSEAIRTKERYSIDHRIILPDGEVRHIHEDAQFLQDESTGRALRMVGTAHDITEQKVAEEALKTSEARFRRAFAKASVGFAITSTDGVILHINEHYCHITGYAENEMVGSSFESITHPDDIARKMELGQWLHAGEISDFNLENRYLRKSGDIAWVENSVSVIRDDAGVPQNRLVLCKDITARKEAEDLLRKTNLRYERQRSALAGLMRGGVMQAVQLDEAFREITAMIARTTEVERVSIWRFDQDHRAIVCRELFEASVERHSSGLELHGKDYPAYFRALEKNEMIAASDARSDDRTREFADGYLKPLGITSMLDAPIHLNGVLEGVLCQEHVGPARAWTPEEQSFAVSMANLISLVLAQWERRQIEEKLRQQASLLDKAQDAILVRNLDHTITYWNKSAETLYGWTAEEAVGKNISELIYRDATPFRDATHRVLAVGEWTGEIRQVNKAGDDVIVEVRWTLVRDAEGQPRSILAINTNVTEKKKLESQFLRVQRMESIGTLAGGIAHDLNNVLTPIMMSIDLLKLRITDPACRETLATIATSALRGAEMINQVLSFARGVEGQKLPVQIGHLLQHIARIVRDTFPRNIQLSTQEQPGIWTVFGDATQIHQVLLNLCVNARDAMPAGGTITIRAENVMIDAQYAAMNIEATEGPHVVISVEDEGAGIPREIIDKIFDPFFTTKDVGKGTGLGLSTSLAILKSHSGFFRVYSEPGHGTRFSIYFPAESGAVKEKPIPEEQPLPRGNNELILVVDDEVTVREITRQTLEAFGYRVLLAEDGAEAVTLYAQHPGEIALVLTDMMMPIMDGPTTIQVLMKMNPKIRIIAASGITSNSDVARASGAGVKHFLPKPYAADTILRSIHLVLAENVS